MAYPGSEYAGERTETSQTGSIQGLVDDYEKICSVAEKMWQEKGDHALLHHLNALYGQVPITFSAVAHLMRL